MGTERKRITAKEIREMGLLWKINRDILHPLGLALEVIIDDDGTETFGGVWDSRDDPEGFLYGDEAWLEGQKKYLRYMEEEGRKAHGVRLARLGYIEQPHPEKALSEEERRQKTKDWLDSIDHEAAAVQPETKDEEPGGE